MNAEIEYAIGRFMKVRKLSGTFQINDSWITGGTHHKRRRYKLYAVKGTGAILEVTEAFADDMEPLPVAQPVELSLAPDPFPSDAIPAGLHIPDATAPQEHEAPAGHTEPAPHSAQPVADAIRSPDALDYGAYGGELDEYSVGARVQGERGELQNPLKPVRNWPTNPTYQDLRGIVYNARFKGLEKLSSSEIDRMDPGTPIAVAVSHETNGHAIWIIITEGDDLRRCRLEVFYPNATGSSADALEYAVLLALRQVPVRSDDLEMILLELSA